MIAKTVNTEVWQALGGNFSNVKSLSLRLNKYLRIGKEVNQVNGRVIRRDSKPEEIALIAGQQWSAPADANHNSLLPAYHGTMNSLPGSAFFEVTLKSRMMVDMAGGVLENSGLCIHPHWNVPMIPGSALKGLASHQMWIQWSEEKDSTKKDELARQMVRIFGYPLNKEDLDKALKDSSKEEDVGSLAGTIDFLPAMASDSQVTLEQDILTPHTGNNPIPNAFLAVSAGTRFICRLRKNSRGTEGDLQVAVNALKTALDEHGAGAKTAAGYGWLVVSRDGADILEEQRKREEEARAKREAQEREERERKEIQERERAARERNAARAQMTPAEKFMEKCQTDGAWDEKKLISQLNIFSLNRITDADTISAMLQFLHEGVCNDIWKNKLKPLIGVKYKTERGKPNLRQIAESLDRKDRELHPQEAERLL